MILSPQQCIKQDDRPFGWKGCLGCLITELVILIHGACGSGGICAGDCEYFHMPAPSLSLKEQ